MRDEIRILFPELKPAINRCPGKFPRTKPGPYCSNPGFMVEILAMIADQLKIKIIPVAVDVEDRKGGHKLGSIVGNKSTGFLSYIIEDRVDTIAIPFHDYGASRRMFDLSTPIYNTTASFFYHKQIHRGNNWFEFFKVYDKLIWVSFGLLLCVVILFLHLAKSLEIKLQQRQKPDIKERMNTHCQIIWYALQFMLGHANYKDFRFSAVNIGLLILSCCYGIAILGIYGSWILSLKLNPTIMLPIQDINRLAKLINNKEYHLIATPNKARDFGLLRRANLSILRTISEAVERNPVHLAKNDSEIVEHLILDQSVVYTEADEQLYLDLQMHCGITELKEHISHIPAVFVFRKDNKFMEPFNIVIRKHRDLIGKIMNRYMGLDADEINEHLCQRDKAADRLPYFGLCASLGGMGALGVLILLIENAVFYIRNATKISKTSTASLQSHEVRLKLKEYKTKRRRRSSSF